MLRFPATKSHALQQPLSAFFHLGKYGILFPPWPLNLFWNGDSLGLLHSWYPKCSHCYHPGNSLLLLSFISGIRDPLSRVTFSFKASTSARTFLQYFTAIQCFSWDTGCHSDFRSFEHSLPLPSCAPFHLLSETYRNFFLPVCFEISLCCALTWVFFHLLSWVPSGFFQDGHSCPSVLGKSLAFFPSKISLPLFSHCGIPTLWILGWSSNFYTLPGLWFWFLEGFFNFTF